MCDCATGSDSTDSRHKITPVFCYGKRAFFLHSHSHDRKYPLSCRAAKAPQDLPVMISAEAKRKDILAAAQAGAGGDIVKRI
jgi:hypothetical protein